KARSTPSWAATPHGTTSSCSRHSRNCRSRSTSLHLRRHPWRVSSARSLRPTAVCRSSQVRRSQSIAWLEHLCKGRRRIMPPLWQQLILGIIVATAIALRFLPALRGYQFTAWIIAAFLGGMIFPQNILHPGGLDASNAIVILTVVQLVM